MLDVSAARARGALRPQGDRAATLVLEREHLLLDDVRCLAHPACEQLGGLEDRGLDRAVAGAREHVVGDAQQLEPAAAVIREHVEGAARRPYRLGH